MQDALHLAAEIGVAWGVDDVDAGVLPGDRGHLGENGNAALTLKIVGIHGALRHPLILAEGAGLLQQAIHERGFAVVDLIDDSDIAEFHWILNVQTRARKARGDLCSCI